MLNVKIISQPIGPEGIYGSVDLNVVDGKIVSAVTISPKGILDEAAKKIGGSAPAIAAGLESAVGLG